MTKDELMEFWDSIISARRCTLESAEKHLQGLATDAYFDGDLHLVVSGGSSGKRCVVAYDWHGWAVCAVGLMRGFWAMNQCCPIWCASLSACAAGHATSALLETFSNPSHPNVRAPISLPIQEIVTILNETQPPILHTYPTMLPILCEEASKGRLQIKPKFIWSTSETLLSEVKALAEKTWGVPVLDHWAASESSGGAFCCLRSPGFHIAEDLNIIEAVDERGKPVEPGKWSAKIFVTNLYNRVMPLLRYEIPDGLRIAETPCSCGSKYLHATAARARLDEVFDYGNDIKVHAENFEVSLEGRAISEYQVYQTSRGVEVNVVARRDFDIESLRFQIKQSLLNLGVSNPEVIVRCVDRLERMDSGKVRRFIPLLEANR
jgi:phenylacetate-coenzyme A ligase PaaK-like adenylate-forming protein